MNPLYHASFKPVYCITNPSYCHAPTTSRVEAVSTGVSDGLEGFKAHAVFQEINKKLQKVMMRLDTGDSIVNEGACDSWCHTYEPPDTFQSLARHPYWSVNSDKFLLPVLKALLPLA